MNRQIAIVTAILLALPWLAQAQVAAVVPPVLPGTAAAPADAEGVVRVPVLKDAVTRGQLIRAENITMQPVDASRVFASTITSADVLAGQQANRNLAAGQPINKLHVEVAPTVRRNSSVTLRFVRGGVELVSQGQALEDGTVGQAVRVLNPATRTTLTGRVAEDGTVDVN